MKRFFLILFFLFLVLINPVGAVGIPDPSFESGNLDDWVVLQNTGSHAAVLGGVYGDYCAHLSHTGYNAERLAIGAGECNSCSFWGKKSGAGSGDVRFDYNVRVPVTSSTWQKYYYNNSFTSIEMIAAGGGDSVTMWIDHFRFNNEPDTPKNYITWDTSPPDTWSKGNYSTLIVGVPYDMDFDFYYKVPNGDYVLTPIQKSFIGRYYNVEAGEFYQDYAKICYHAVHGNYSAKLVIDGFESSQTDVYIPYIDLDIDPPDSIIIPIPDIIVAPPNWNVTVPPKYDNVSWLTNYTDFWDGVGDSINYTQYATVGLLLTPLEALNTSVHTLFVYVDDASGMIQGFEHCAIIVRSGWDVIPSEIQTLFIGSASLGVVVFLLHRRT